MNDVAQDMMTMYAVSPEMEAMRWWGALRRAQIMAMGLLRRQGWTRITPETPGQPRWENRAMGCTCATLDVALAKIGGVI